MLHNRVEYQNTIENNIVHIDQIVTYLSEAEELYSVHPWCGPFAGTSVGSIVHHSRLSSFKHYNISTFSFFIQLSRFMSTKSSKILFHLLLHNRVKYQYSVESIPHTCWSDCYLLITSWRVILQCIFGVLRLLGHPLGRSLVFRQENLFSEKYSILKHTSKIM